MSIEEAQKEAQEFFNSEGITVNVECIVESEEHKHLKIGHCLLVFKDGEWLVLEILKRSHPYQKDITLTSLVGEYSTLAEALLDNYYLWIIQKPA